MNRISILSAFIYVIIATSIIYYLSINNIVDINPVVIAIIIIGGSFLVKYFSDFIFKKNE